MWMEWKKRAEVRRLTSFERFICVRKPCTWFTTFSQRRFRVHIFVCFVGGTRIFRCFSGITPPLCVGHKCRWWLTITYHQMHPSDTLRFWWVKPPRGGSAFMYFCLFLFVTISALACRPNWLIWFSNIVTRRVSVSVMATASSQRAMIFSAGGHVVAWGLDFRGQYFPLWNAWQKWWPSLSRNRCVLEQKGANNTNKPPPTA